MQYTERTKTFSGHEETNAEVVVVATVDAAAAAAAVANGNWKLSYPRVRICWFVVVLLIFIFNHRER